jgi:hypothetical protein
MMANKMTTIPLKTPVRDRLKTYGSMGDTYSDILTHMMDEIERKAFLARLRAERDDPKAEWATLEELGWDK